ncbi:MAG: signal peptidase I [Bacilli bacterium]|nr:signal peptidase I [Bacilli bacterium]
MEEEKRNIVKEIIPYIVIIVVVIFIRSFIITPVQVEGTSMYPTLKDNEVLMLKKYDQTYERFDIVVFEYNNTKLIKRVIGLPGETVEYKNGELYINDNYVEEKFSRNSQTDDFKLSDIKLNKIPQGYYFVMGDNRNNSTDSRIIGVVSSDKIKGTTNFSVFPFDTFGKIN